MSPRRLPTGLHLATSVCAGRWLFLLASGLGVHAGLAQRPPASPGPAYSLSVLADRSDATYHVRGEVTFDVTLTHDGKPVPAGNVEWSLTQDGVTPALDQGTAAVKDGHAAIAGRLSAPGFLQCKVLFKAGTEVVRGLGAAAVDPLDIKPVLPVPEDFDAFWASKKSALRAVPINARLTLLPAKSPRVELFDVQADAVGERPMSGLYARPAGAAPRSLPAIITLEGAGVYPTRLEPSLMGWARDGYLSLELNAHGLPTSRPNEFYLDLEKGALKDYQLFGRTSRETFYFLEMYLRAVRGVDFLTAQPEWNGRTLIASGGSQGAAQAIFLAAEDARVTFLAVSVPAMCDHAGMLGGRVVGWPRLIPVGADGKPDPAILEVSRYYDSVNFAARVRVPSFWVVGFIDQTAPPTSVYAAYNNLRGEKEIYPAVRSPHRISDELWQEIRRRILLRK